MLLCAFFCLSILSFFFFFNDTATTEIYTLSLHDALPILLLRLGGTPSGEHGVGRLRAGLLERFYGPEVAALFRELKQAYDPRCTLNPGVIIPSADWAPLADLKVGPEAAPIPNDIAARLREVERTAGWATPKLDLATPSPQAPNP